MTAEEIGIETLDDELIDMLSELILCSWPSTKAEVQKGLQPYSSFRDEIAVIAGIRMMGRRTVTPAVLQEKALKQLYLSHVQIEKTRLLVCESVYWYNMNMI